MTSTGMHAALPLPPSPAITTTSLQASCANSLTPSATNQMISAARMTATGILFGPTAPLESVQNLETVGNAVGSLKANGCRPLCLGVRLLCLVATLVLA